MLNSFIKPLFSDIKTFVLDTLFPNSCIVCEKEGELLCNECKSQLTYLEHQHCIACQKLSVGGLTHPLCQTPYGANALISMLNYRDDAVSKIIIHGKYYFLSEVYKILGRMMAEKLKKSYSNLLASNQQTILVPIPLSSWRKRWRGFNQAEILCKVIGKELSLEVSDILKRKRWTGIQKNIKNRQARITNMQNAFALKSPPKIGGVSPVGGRGGVADDYSVKNRNFILVDDVVTTGSTLLEGVKVLKRSGASKVFCLTVARD